MGLQEQIAEAIVIAFDELGGDPYSAIEAALEHDSVESWIQQETAKVAVAGGAEMLIPGLHAVTIPAGISYLIHKMAHISWGIGAIKGAYIVETSRHSDLRNILTIWANDGFFNAHLLDHLGVSMEAFQHALSPEGKTALRNALVQDDSGGVVIKTFEVLEELVLEFSADEKAQQFVSMMNGQSVDELLVSARQYVPDDRVASLEKPLSRRISTKLALRLAARISARVPARILVGFLPVAGALINAFFNAQTITNMAESASKYYDNALRAETLQAQQTND